MDYILSFCSSIEVKEIDKTPKTIRLHGKNALIISDEFSSIFEEIKLYKLDNTQLIFINKNDVAAQIVEQLSNYVYDNVGVMLNGYMDDKKIIHVLNHRMICQKDLMKYDAGCKKLMYIIKLIRAHCDGYLHIFCGEIGKSNEMKYVFGACDKEVNYTKGISVSCNPFSSEEWGKLGWNTKIGFRIEKDEFAPIGYYISAVSKLNFTNLLIPECHAKKECDYKHLS